MNTEAKPKVTLIVERYCNVPKNHCKDDVVRVKGINDQRIFSIDVINEDRPYLTQYGICWEGFLQGKQYYIQKELGYVDPYSDYYEEALDKIKIIYKEFLRQATNIEFDVEIEVLDIVDYYSN